MNARGERRVSTPSPPLVFYFSYLSSLRSDVVVFGSTTVQYIIGIVQLYRSFITEVLNGPKLHSQ